MKIHKNHHETIREICWNTLHANNVPFHVRDELFQKMAEYCQSIDDETETLKSFLGRLSIAVHEQQYTLNSAGWNIPENRTASWSKAGARFYQWQDIELILADIYKFYSD